MMIAAYVVIAWFGGMFAADQVRTNATIRVCGRVEEFCRPQCYNSVGIVPFPFRWGRYKECAKDGDVDQCTGEIREGGRWVKPVTPPESKCALPRGIISSQSE